LCGPDRRPSWFDAPAPDVTLAPWQIVAPVPNTKPVDVEGIRLRVLADKHDGTWYLQRKTFEEKVSLLYGFIRDEGFTNFIDIGANVGFVSMLARRAAPALKIIAVEADPRLVRLIEANFSANDLAAPVIVNAIAGSRSAPETTFSLNPSSTLDNRVSVPHWPQIAVPTVTTDMLLERHALAGRTFFKIDTQGFELQVLQGIEAYLTRHADWVLKMEFAPDWLSSQGTDPMVLLGYLQQRYEFAEFPERIAFGSPGLDTLFGNPISLAQHRRFLDHVVSLNKGGLGWVDLIVRPRGRR
jgi:FkbM family methyltransferase